MNMDLRKQQLLDLIAYRKEIEKETTLLLQNLQWDRKSLEECREMVVCQYDPNHRIPCDARDNHESKCYLAQQGYTKQDVLLPDPIDPNADTVVKLGKQDIVHIINMASASNPMFKKQGHQGPEPMTVERLEQTYSADERRAIHDAVVSAAPSCHDLTDLALNSGGLEPRSSKAKSRVEILAELRDMKRRRAKYRVAAKTRNYSHVLKDVIRTQMESLSEARGITIKTEYGSRNFINLDQQHRSNSDGTATSSQTYNKKDRLSPKPDHCRENTSVRKHRSRSREFCESHRERSNCETNSKISYMYDDKDRRSSHRSYEHYMYKDKSKDRYKDGKQKHDKYYRDEKYTNAPGSVEHHGSKIQCELKDGHRYDNGSKKHAKNASRREYVHSRDRKEEDGHKHRDRYSSRNESYHKENKEDISRSRYKEGTSSRSRKYEHKLERHKERSNRDEKYVPYYEVKKEEISDDHEDY